jgi:hypothetical protein
MFVKLPCNCFLNLDHVLVINVSKEEDRSQVSHEVVRVFLVGSEDPEEEDFRYEDEEAMELEERLSRLGVLSD